ncbi:MAG TPA: hypothetical protein VMU39_22495 [Solirubrobacteraceae bacterium]|nr:hypothetical protein [Solirubrobacteraceae bacterium]
MDFKQLDRGELIAVAGGVLLGVSVFLPWYTLGNPNAQLNSCRGPHTSCSGWNSLTVLRFLLLLTAIAPAILAYIIVRGHALSWPRGELTAVTALAALAFTLFRGVIDRPGSPPGEISVGFGWWVALLGSVLILVGALARTREAGPRRKPPGVL